APGSVSGRAPHVCNSYSLDGLALGHASRSWRLLCRRGSGRTRASVAVGDESLVQASEREVVDDLADALSHVECFEVELNGFREGEILLEDLDEVECVLDVCAQERDLGACGLELDPAPELVVDASAQAVAQVADQAEACPSEPGGRIGFGHALGPILSVVAVLAEEGQGARGDDARFIV